MAPCDRILIYKFEGHWGGQIIAESVDKKFTSALGNYVEDSCFQDQVCNLYQGKDPVVANNVYEQGYTPCHIKLLEQYQVKANLIVPLEVSGELWGLLIGHQCETYREWQ
ncbi:GAF domain-containing protein [Cyanobacterium aponinum]|uniref:GAF domain-containing protein n=1 Tax=Cyanobacterium aponinum TaxID=379064 RepID=UPI0002F0331A|nr:GAF domain-containing protein [Cyanobacterium aponinum]